MPDFNRLPTAPALALPAVVQDDARDVMVMKLEPGSVPGLTPEESAEANGTSVHALRLMEMMLLSGRLTVPEMIDVTKELARYQFQTANRMAMTGKSLKKKAEKTTADLLKEIAGG
jgi:hypothetical protein